MEKAFHPFIAGPYNRLVGEIMQETGTRINIPPPSVNRTEIVFTGEKEQLAQAVARIKKIYEEKVQCLRWQSPWIEQLMEFRCGNLANTTATLLPLGTKLAMYIPECLCLVVGGHISFLACWVHCRVVSCFLCVYPFSDL